MPGTRPGLIIGMRGIQATMRRHALWLAGLAAALALIALVVWRWNVEE
jgi:hypothetical protein